MIKYFIALCCFILSWSFLAAQVDSVPETFNLNFIFEVEGTAVELGSPIVLKDESNTIKIDALRFYISDIRWKKQPDLSKNPKDRYHLIDAAEPQSQNLRIPATKANSALYFGFGVDSLTNDAGVHGGDLDPTKGMYWAWQTGYVNFKIEGSNKACKNFGYHLGGFLDGLDASTEVSLPFDFSKVESSTDGTQVQLVFEIADFLKKAEAISGCHLMRPSAEAVSLAQAFQKHLTLR